MNFLIRTILFLLIFIHQSFANQTPLKIAITTDMVPYSYINENNEASGILVDYWKLWSQKSNQKIEFIPSSWENTLKNLKEKKVDIHSGLFLNKERQKYINYLQPIYNSTTNIYINVNDTNKIKSIKDLNNKSIGLVVGTYFETYIQNNYPSIKIKKYETYKELLDAISQKEVDSFIDDSLTTWFQLVKYIKFNEVATLPNFKLTKWFYVGIVKDNKKLKKIVLSGMNKITENEIISIEKKWIVDDNLRYFQKQQNLDLLTTKERHWLEENPMIQLAVVKHWKRYSFLDENRKLKGFHLDLLKQINKNLNINIKYIAYDTWTEAYNMAKNGDVDGIFGLSWSKEREKFFNYSPSYKYSPYYIVGREDENDIKTLKDFNTKTAATYENSITNKIIKNRAPNTKIIHLNNVSDILKNIRDNHADVALLENAKTINLKEYNLKIISSVFTKEGELSIGTSKNKKVFANIIKKGINSISEEQMQTLVNKWFKEETEASIFTKEELSYIKKSPVLKVGVEDWKPIIYSNDGKKIEGVAGEIVAKVFEISGLKTQIVRNSWDALLNDFKNKKIDILPATYYTKQRTSYGLYGDKYLTMKEFIYAKDDNNNIKSFFDLNHKKLAIVKDYGTIPIIKEKFPNIIIVETKNLEESIHKVLEGDVEALFETQIAMQYKKRKLLITNLKAISQNSIKASPIHVFSKNSDLILQSILNKSLYSISTAEKNKIINKWLTVETKKNVNVAFVIGREPYSLDKAFLKGIEYDLVKKILSINDISIKNRRIVSLNNMDDALEDDKTLDIVVTVKEKDDGYYYSKNFISFENVAVSRREDNLFINDFSDLKDKKIIAFEGAYKYLGKEYNKMFNLENRLDSYQEVDLQEKQVKDFLDEKTDVIILDKNIFKWYLKKLSDNSLNQYKLDFIFSGKNSYKVAFRDENLRNIFNENLEVIKTSGEYENVFYNYIQSDIEAKVQIDSLISSIVSKYIFTDETKKLKNILKAFTSLEYINKIEVYNNENRLVGSSSSLNLKKYTMQDSFYLMSNIPQKVGFIKVYFDEEKLTHYSNNADLIPEIEIFKELASYTYIKDVYKRFDYLDKKLVFTKKEKMYIRNHPIITFSEVNWQPLSIIKDEKFSGLFDDYMKVIEQKSGLEFKYIKADSVSDMMNKFKNNTTDIIPGIGNVAKSLKLGLVSNEFINFNYAIITNKDASFVNGLKDLTGKIVAVPKGYSSYNMIKIDYPHINIIPTKDINESLTLVSQGKAYSFVGHMAVSIFNIKNKFPELKIAGITQEKFQHHFLVQKSQSELLSIINKVISSISHKQKDDIKAKWIKTKISTAVDYSVIYKLVAIFTLIIIIVLIFTKKLLNAKKEIERTNEKLNQSINTLVNTQDELEDSNHELEISLENLKLTQNQLVESEKMAGLGGLVAGVAHEINTPVGIGLTGITHFLQITEEIKKDYESDNMTQEAFESYLNVSEDLANQINLNLKRMAHLVRSFKQVAVDQTSEERRTFNLKEYIDEVLLSITNITKKTKLDIVVKGEDSLIINSYPGAFSQIISNLIINSIRHAYKDKEEGTILIDVIQDNDIVKLIYKDDGRGISKKNLEKIFDPFFTTNREKGGTGLGLNVIYNIVNNMLKGTISCTSEEGSGTEFIITISLGEEIINDNDVYHI